MGGAERLETAEAHPLALVFYVNARATGAFRKFRQIEKRGFTVDRASGKQPRNIIHRRDRQRLETAQAPAAPGVLKLFVHAVLVFVAQFPRLRLPASLVFCEAMSFLAPGVGLLATEIDCQTRAR
jgi:hypothetical protein